MVHEFPKRTQKQPDDSELRIRLDMTFDVPKEIADQLEMWGFNTFEDCEYCLSFCPLQHPLQLNDLPNNGGMLLMV